jgi:hypothetical protein
MAVERATVTAEEGNIVVETGGVKTVVTHSGRDREPVLSPDGKTVVFTRLAHPAASEETADVPTACPDPPDADEIREIGIDGSGERLLVAGRASEKPEEALCGFTEKQFNADGSRLFFLTPAFVTSSALHEYRFATGKERYVMGANDLIVLSACANEHKDQLVVAQHRYFAFGGSYDWYWLFDKDGKTDLGPATSDDDPESVRRTAADEWCAD